MTGFVLLFVGIGALLVAMSIPLIRRRIRPNPIYGLRVPATLADADVWYEANAQSGRDLCILGCIQVAVALLLLVFPGITIDGYIAVNSAVVTVGALVAAVVGWRRANRLLAMRKTE